MHRSRLARALGAMVLLALLGLGLAGLVLRADKRHVFAEVAGELGTSRVVETLATAGGSARLVELVNDRDEVVASAWIRRPARLARDYRVVLVYSGQETGRKILDLVPERDDLVLVAPQYPYRRPRGPVAHLRWPYDVRRAAFRTVAGGVLAVSHLERVERLDARRLLVVGASLGSSFAVIHAALDTRVPRLVIVHGGGDLPLIVRTIETRRGHPWRGRLAAGLAAVLVDSFDPVHYVAEIAPREVVVIGARGDHQFPAASTLALYERAGQPKTLRWTSGAHVRSARDAALAEVLAEIERQLGRELPDGEHRHTPPRGAS
jgi:hypothetical protein